MSISMTRLWRFFASVKLALFTLFILAATSILGTFIEQKKTPDFYVEEYGDTLAGFLQLLDITNMYNSWWFIGLLLLFSVNLIVCSFERLPSVWQSLAQADTEKSPEQLKKMACSFSIDASAALDSTSVKIQQALTKAGWKRFRVLPAANVISIAAQRGAWTRLAVYVVHLSVLVILAGALIGNFFGFQGYVFLPEGRSTDRVFYQKDGEALPLGFEFYCDRAEKKLYPDGMVSEYRADLRIIDSPRNQDLEKSIVVNDPLNYRGISFYLGDFFPIDEFFVVLTNHTDGTEQAFRVPPEMEFDWPDTQVIARLEEFTRSDDGAIQLARVSFSADPTEESAEVWVRNNNSAAINHGGEQFSISLRQLTTVLFLVNKDPGVMVVYAGFILLMLGLYICFFLSHRRIWVHLTATKKGTGVLVGGTSNKNKPGFEKAFSELTTKIAQEL